MLIEQIDAIRAQALEHSLDDLLDVLGPTVEPGTPLTGLLIDVPAKLGGDDDLVSEGRHGLAQDPLHFEGAIGLGGIKERHP